MLNKCQLLLGEKDSVIGKVYGLKAPMYIQGLHHMSIPFASDIQILATFFSLKFTVVTFSRFPNSSIHRHPGVRQDFGPGDFVYSVLEKTIFNHILCPCTCWTLGNCKKRSGRALAR